MNDEEPNTSLNCSNSKPNVCAKEIPKSVCPEIKSAIQNSTFDAALIRISTVVSTRIGVNGRARNRTIFSCDRWESVYAEIGIVEIYYTRFRSPLSVVLCFFLRQYLSSHTMKTSLPIKPPRLRRGDLIGLVSPSSPVAEAERIQNGVRYLESLGYRVIVGEHVGKAFGYLAGTDEERAADLHAMFADKDVRAIVCVRGGYGTTRLLSLLDYRLIARHPKILVGFSDVTALQLALWRKCRLVTFHGPMAGVEMAKTMHPFTEEMFWRCITSSRALGELHLPEQALVLSAASRAATGRLIGGNLSLVVSLLGTNYAPAFVGAVLFLEEIAEEPYRVDRMLTHLRNASAFTDAVAMLFGDFTACVPSDPTKPSFRVDDVLVEAARQFGKPTLARVPFGHGERKLTLPIGIRVRVDIRRRSIALLESAVA